MWEWSYLNALAISVVRQWPSHWSFCPICRNDQEDEIPSIVGIERPAIELTDDYQKERDNFLEQMQSLLDANAAIDLSSFYTHPLMNVGLIIPPGVTVF